MKQESTFARWQEAGQVEREGLIIDFLAYLKTTRVRADHPTALAALVARHLSTTQGKPCSTSTLLRNLRYKSKILAHHAEHRTPGAKSLDRKLVTDPAAKVLLASTELGAGNLVREVARLRLYVASLEAQIDKLSQENRPLSLAVGEDPKSLRTGVTDAEFRFIRTCQALNSVANHLNLVLELDSRGRQILDRSKRRDNVIAGQETAGPFFDWLAKSPGRG